MLQGLDDDSTPDAVMLRWPYFETDQPVMWEESETYLGEGEVASPRMYEWGHGIGQVVQAVLDAGLTITGLEEHQVLPWRRLPWMEHVEGTHDWTRMPLHLRDAVPLSYTLQAMKPAD